MLRMYIHSVGQKSIGLKSRTGSHVTYSCHRNSSRLFSPYLRICCFFLSPIHGWKRRVGNYQKLKSDLPLTIQSLTLSWVSCRGLQDKYCHKSEPLREYVEWGEKDNAGNRYFASPSCRADYGPLIYWDCGFESHQGHGCLSFVSVVCCLVEVSSSRWSLVRRSPIKCDREAPQGEAIRQRESKIRLV